MHIPRPTLVALCACIAIVGCGAKKEAQNMEKKNQTPTTSQQKSPQAAPTESADEVAVIDTKFGKIILEFYPGDAPGHVANFKKLASSGFYDGCTFHRVIPNFMIQGGDPNSKDADRANDGLGGPGYTINAEFNKRQHLRGILSMARTPDPNSAGSQFFICVADIPHLDGQYTVFGKVIKGIEVVDQIVSLPRDQKDNPLDPAIMLKVSILPRSKVNL
jgi:peptidyl-prolyl cis-trans isomerase B (cyclophilin B)